ncbi:hypothetical protein VTK26DRAFT_3654 [Humicola hyalothermophila]
MVEGGRNNAGMPTITHPAYFLSHLAPGSTTNLFHKTNKSAAVGSRKLTLPAGGVLGGGSSTNFLMYSRAQKSDLDAWGVPGWSSAEMLPYLKKLESYHGKDEKGVHGRDGPIHVSRGPFASRRLEDQFTAAAAKVGWPEVEDVQDMETVNAVGRAYRYSQITRILFDDGKAVGVEFRPNPIFGGDASAVRSVKGRKLVIAACGACGTPALLERSGVCDPRILPAAGVPVVAPVPGVGNGFQDHHLLVYPYLNSLDDSGTIDALAHGRMGTPEELIKQNHPMLGWNAQDVQAVLVSLDAPLPADVPDIEYAREDDAVLEKWLRENVNTTWHSLGTCKMAPREQNGVVDANLGVYGLKNLKVADLSVVPHNVAANTNSVALAVGEKAADIFIAEIGQGLN